MSPSKFKLLIVWNIVLTTLLVVMLGIVATVTYAANDSPVEVFTAELDHPAGIAGNATGTNKVINSTTFLDVLTVSVNFTGQTHNHYCTAIASANVINPGNGTGHLYEFGVGVDDAGAGSYSNSNMILDLSDNAGVNDPSWWPVTTNRTLSALTPAVHTVRFQARKQAAGDPNFEIDNASMTVLCFKKYQTLFDTFVPDEPSFAPFVNDK